MTEAFERFVDSQTEDLTDWEDYSPLGKRAAYFWLTAFVLEVRRMEYPESGLDIQSDETGTCFNALVRSFGLDGEEMKPGLKAEIEQLRKLYDGSLLAEKDTEIERLKDEAVRILRDDNRFPRMVARIAELEAEIKEWKKIVLGLKEGE